MTGSKEPTPGGAVQEAAASPRSLLSVGTNPNVALDYLNLLAGEAPDAGVHVTLRYVPDKLLLSPDAFATYLAAFDENAAASLEGIALAILADINNEVVPRWVQVVAERSENAAGTSQCVLVEDRQPKWDNTALLARLKRI